MKYDKDGRAIALDINVSIHGEYLVSVYASVGGVNSTHADQEVCCSAIHWFVYNKHPTTFGGNFNCVDNIALDRTSYDVQA